MSVPLEMTIVVEDSIQLKADGPVLHLLGSEATPSGLSARAGIPDVPIHGNRLRTSKNPCWFRASSRVRIVLVFVETCLRHGQTARLWPPNGRRPTICVSPRSPPPAATPGGRSSGQNLSTPNAKISPEPSGGETRDWGAIALLGEPEIAAKPLDKSDLKRTGRFRKEFVPETQTHSRATIVGPYDRFRRTREGGDRENRDRVDFPDVNP